MSGTFTNRIIFTRCTYSPSLHIGTETLQVGLLFHKSLSYRYTFSSLCLLTELRKAAHHTTYSTKQHHIRDFTTCYRIRYLLPDVNQHRSTCHRRHRSRRLTSARVLTRLFFYSHCKLISSFSFRVSLIPLCIFYRSVRIQLHVNVALVRKLPEGELSRINAYFHTPSVLVNSAKSFDFRQAIALLDNALEHFNTHGSGFVLEYVKRYIVSTLRYRRLHGSTYIPTPTFLAAKHCVINVQNFNDSKCFLWSVLSALYEPTDSKKRVTNYLKYESSVDMTGINYPVQTKQIPLFEKQNPSISINVLTIEPDTKSFTIEYLSSERGRQHHINLLLLEDPQDTTKHHYVRVTNMSRLLAHRSKHHPSTYVCNSCLHSFSTPSALENHIPFCLQHPSQQVQYPDPENCKLEFANVKKQHTVSLPRGRLRIFPHTH